MRIARIFKINTSYAIIIPPSIYRTLKWKEKDYVVLEIFEKDVVLSRLEFPPHVVKRLSERRQRVYDQFQGAGKELEKT